MKLCCLLLVALSIASMATAADDGVRAQALALIEQTQRQADQQELEKNDQLAQLRQLELDRLRLENERDQLTRSLNLSQSTYDGIDSANLQMRNRLDNQLVLLEKLALVAYNQYKESPLKILFHTDDVDQWYRNLTYYRYTTGYQLAQLEKTNAQIGIQEKLLSELVETKKKIGQQKKQLDQRLASLRLVEQERKTILTTLSNQIEASARRIERLNQQLIQVDRLTNQLGNLQVDEIVVNETDFRSLRGKLPLPTNGKIKQTFSANKSSSQESTLHRKGMVIQTRYGSPVNAIARGHVVFSDWIHGFGQVIIIDHGDDYLSLYAHNSQLLKQTGDWVNTDEVISLVGETGGRKVPELYFELRHKSVAINPVNWFAIS